jgi:hypothetical protein
MSPHEVDLIKRMLSSPLLQLGSDVENQATRSDKAGTRNGRWLRVLAKRVLDLYPEPFRSQAIDGAIKMYLGTEAIAGASVDTVRRIAPSLPVWARKSVLSSEIFPKLDKGRVNLEDFSRFTDLITVGNGWDYFNYDNLYRFKKKNRIRIHGFVHDLIAVDRPYYFHKISDSSRLHQHYAELCHISDTLICNSFATSESLIDFIKREALPKPKISVAQLPIFHKMEVDTQAVGSLTGCDFIPFVSTIEVRKNHLLLLNIWRECILEGRNMPTLVFVGREGWGVQQVIDMIAHDQTLSNYVQVHHDISDAQLAWLYDRCLFTVYPSNVEGWGLPIGEAMGRERICVHSTDPAQSEASQGLMPAHHPGDFIGWKSTILDLIDRPLRRKRLETMIREQYKPISSNDFGLAVRAAIGV